ncbi:winged helix-turn-helix domain-containing protein [Streptomyces pseudovenezuelae]|uniref:winged helix-turn-helix domain-containing protein n=1 Tax=Streptomyces pseudovenezuelae TaxID=67350 RepID=UPI0034A40395
MSDDRSNVAAGRVEDVLQELRRRILTKQYPKGTRLPPQRELAEQLGVSRDTVQRALRELVEDHWIESRQGSGSRVIKDDSEATVIKEPEAASETDSIARMEIMELGRFVQQALAEDEMNLDVYCLTSESLDTHLRVQAEHILDEWTSTPPEGRGDKKPKRISIRLLLPSADLDLPYPRSLTREDDKRMVERLRAISDRCIQSLRATLGNLQANGPVEDLDIEVKYVPITPVMKLYILNRKQAFEAPYKLDKRRIPLDGPKEVKVVTVDAIDVLSVGTRGTYFDKGDETNDAQAAWVDAHQGWFDSLWDRLAK